MSASLILKHHPVVMEVRSMRDHPFVPASRLYDVDNRTPIAHQATDEQIRCALQDKGELA